jgi:hypothetical protein
MSDSEHWAPKRVLDTASDDADPQRGILGEAEESGVQPVTHAAVDSIGRWAIHRLDHGSFTP